MSKQIILTVVVKEEDKGYSVVCPELNVESQGETFEEIISNIKEATEVSFETPLPPIMMNIHFSEVAYA
mgnify:CR=1 FL=1